MAIESNGRAPYAPPSAVLGLIQRYRDRGLQTPFNLEVLQRAGISDSLAPRTLQALQLLDLMNEDGSPTTQMEALRRASTSDFQKVLGDIVRAAYADAFSFIDPAQESADHIQDAFRGYEPRGQMARMVTLFMGLCEAAGIISSAAARTRSAPAGGNSPSRPRPSPQRQGGQKPKQPGSSRPPVPDGLPPALAGLLASLPPNGWNQDRRDQFVTTFSTVLDFCIPIVESGDQEEDPE